MVLKPISKPYTKLSQMQDLKDTLLLIGLLMNSQTEADKNLLLGFGIENFDQTILALKELQIPFSSKVISGSAMLSITDILHWR